jgi:hypothetical protein
MTSSFNRSALARRMLKEGKPRVDVISELIKFGCTRSSAESLITKARHDVGLPVMRRGRPIKGRVRDYPRFQMRISPESLLILDNEALARSVDRGRLVSVLMELICADNMFDAVLADDLPRTAVKARARSA